LIWSTNGWTSPKAWQGKSDKPKTRAKRAAKLLDDDLSM
jgi:hypothetical protein